MSTPTPDENQPMRDALQRDATRVPIPDFDPALHYSTMRRLRSLAETPDRAFHLSPALAAAAAVLALGASLAIWQIHFTPGHKRISQLPPTTPAPLLSESQPPLGRSSLLVYQAAAEKGDEALLALLDRDSRELLPASLPIFSTSLR